MPNVALRAAATRYQQHTLEGPGEKRSASMRVGCPLAHTTQVHPIPIKR